MKTSFRLMFWSDWGKHPVVQQAWMDGTNTHTIISSGLGWPNGLAVDMERDKLYIADALMDAIEVVDLDGNNR